MKKLIVTIWAFAAVFLLLAGCTKKDSVTYSGLEAGTIRSGIFTTDNGVKMNVVGNDGKFDVTSDRRVLVDYTTHAGMDAKRIDIDVNGLWDAIDVPVTFMQTFPKNAVDTPVRISDAWFNAGYLNILASIEAKDISKHVLLAACIASADGITLRLFHDGSAEPSVDSGNVQDIFLCVPMDSVTDAYEHSCQDIGKTPVFPVSVLMQWTWYALDEKGPVMLYERKGAYKPAASN